LGSRARPPEETAGDGQLRVPACARRGGAGRGGRTPGPDVGTRLLGRGGVGSEDAGAVFARAASTAGSARVPGRRVERSSGLPAVCLRCFTRLTGLGLSAAEIATAAQLPAAPPRADHCAVPGCQGVPTMRRAVLCVLHTRGARSGGVAGVHSNAGKTSCLRPIRAKSDGGRRSGHFVTVRQLTSIRFVDKTNTRDGRAGCNRLRSWNPRRSIGGTTAWDLRTIQDRSRI
jgi:hypothetical protein